MDGIVALVPDRADSAVFAVEMLGLPNSYGLHHSTKPTLSARGRDEVVVRRHDREGVNGYVVLARCGVDGLKQMLDVPIVTHDREPIDATRENV